MTPAPGEKRVEADYVARAFHLADVVWRSETDGALSSDRLKQLQAQYLKAEFDELEARLRAVEGELGEWRTGAHADKTGHMHRCAKVNGVWNCADGCAVAKLTQAEQRVAELAGVMTDLLGHTRIAPENGRRLIIAGHGKSYDHLFEKLRGLLTPPPPAP